MRFLRFFLSAGLLLAVLLSPAVAQTPTTTYTVKSGDTLYSISRMYEMTVDELRAMNNLSGTTIRIGQTLTVRTPLTGPRPVIEEPRQRPPSDPVRPTEDNTVTIRTTPRAETPTETADPDAATAAYQQVPRGKRTYTVQPGDTYYSIGIAMGVPAYAIFALNEGDGSPLEAYSTIWVPDAPSRTAPGGSAARTYTVKRGDTMFSIARTHGLTVAALRSANGLSGSQLQIGQRLTLPAAPAGEPARDQPLPPLYEEGMVDIYPDAFAGRVTASGRPYDPTQYTVSHPELPLESVVLLTNPATGMRTFAEVSDRGPADTRYIMDISTAVARELGVSIGSQDPIQVRLVE